MRWPWEVRGAGRRSPSKVQPGWNPMPRGPDRGEGCCQTGYRRCQAGPCLHCWPGDKPLMVMVRCDRGCACGQFRGLAALMLRGCRPTGEFLPSALAGSCFAFAGVQALRPNLTRQLLFAQWQPCRSLFPVSYLNFAAIHVIMASVETRKNTGKSWCSRRLQASPAPPVFTLFR